MFPVENSTAIECTDLFGFMPAVVQTLCMCPFHAYVVFGVCDENVCECECSCICYKGVQIGRCIVNSCTVRWLRQLTITLKNDNG